MVNKYSVAAKQHRILATRVPQSNHNSALSNPQLGINFPSEPQGTFVITRECFAVGQLTKGAGLKGDEYAYVYC